MTLHEIYEVIAPQLPTSTANNLKTAIKILAQVVQYPGPANCPYEAFNRPLREIYHLVEAHLVAQGKKTRTIRNTKNNLSRMFRLATTAGLLTPIDASPTRQFGSRYSAHRPGGMRSRNDGSSLPFRHWPQQLKDDFTAFERWATAPLVEGRDAKWRKRPITIEVYRRFLEGYFGYLHYKRQIPQLKFDHLFDFTFIRDYVHWHVNERFQQPTRSIKDFLKCLITLVHQYHQLPELHAQLKTLNLNIPKPPPYYDKADAWVPTTQLAAIGRNLWPTKPPRAIETDGSLNARNAGLSLIFQLWEFIPYRARNICEMALNTNLRKNTAGKWRIIFAGEQLKIAVKRGKPNILDLPFPDKLIPTLEEYLKVWYPILVAKGGRRFPNVFLNMHGRPYRVPIFRQVTTQIVYAYTGKYWHPHMVRTVWATEWIRDKNPGDFYGAASMLNDTLQTVINSYSHLLSDGIAEKVYERLSQQQGTHP